MDVRRHLIVHGPAHLASRLVQGLVTLGLRDAGAYTRVDNGKSITTLPGHSAYIEHRSKAVHVWAADQRWTNVVPRFKLSAKDDVTERTILIKMWEPINYPRQRDRGRFRVERLLGTYDTLYPGVRVFEDEESSLPTLMELLNQSDSIRLW